MKFKIGQKVKVIDMFKDYAVNTKGDVFRIKTGKILKSRVNEKGYPMVELYKTSTHKVKKSVHVLVARAFLGDYEPKNNLCVNHKDGNKQNSKLSNLEIVTTKYNVLHSMTTVGKPVSKRMVSQYNKEGELIKTFNSVKEASEATNIAISNIFSVCAGNVKTRDRKSGVKNRITAGGYIWKAGSKCKDLYFINKSVLDKALNKTVKVVK